MAIAASAVYSGSLTTDGSTFSITGVTLTAGKCYILFVDTYRQDSTNVAAISSVSGGGQTWQTGATFQHDVSGGTRGRVSGFHCGPVASTVTNQTITVTHSETVGGIGYFLVELSECSGLVQSGANGGAAASGSVTLAAFAKATNLAIGFLALNVTDTITPGSGFSRLTQVSFSDSAVPFMIDSESQVNDNTVDFSWTNGAASWGIVAYEANDILRQAVGGSITPTGTIGKRVAKALSGSITPTGAFASLIARTIYLAGSITPTGAMTTIASYVRSFGGSITPTGTLAALKVHFHLKPIVNFVLNLISSSEDTQTLTQTSEGSETLTPIDEENA